MVELLFSSVLLGIILTGLFLVLSASQLNFTVSSAKTQVQAQTRLAMVWVLKDMRQTISWNISDAGYNPSTTHLKFNLWIWDNGTHTWTLSDDYVEYTYDANAKKLTRSISQGGVITTLEFGDIIESPFYTTYIGPGDPGNLLDADTLRTGRKLIVVISGQKQVRGKTVSSRLQGEIRIRNG